MTFQPYPKALYPKNGPMVIVKDEDEHAAVVASWEPDEMEGDIGDETGNVVVKRPRGRPRKIVE